VWAHPCLFRGGVITEVLKELVDAGLMGVEVYHPNHNSREQKMLLELCAKYGLLVTGGSDYHGPNLMSKDEDRSLNHLHLPIELLTPVKTAAATLQQL
jgi:predicted metal-dependent phosphoesterase TrpH